MIRETRANGDRTALPVKEIFDKNGAYFFLIMFYFFYDVLVLAGALVYLPYYILRGRWHPKIWMRLGFFPLSLFGDVSGRDCVWLHAVSVGEARASETLLELFRRQWPKRPLAVSTVTPTGQEIVRRLIRKGEVSFYAPLDISWVVGKFLRILKPSLVVIMETEIWPNLIRLAHARGVQVVIVNGRISDHSLRGYEKIRGVVVPVLSRVELFCMQNQESAERIIALGAPRDKVKVTGNIKFDITSGPKEPMFFGVLKESLLSCRMLLAGSTHEGEEEILVALYKSLRKDFSDLRLCLAPRHLERVDKIRRLVRMQGLEAVSLSRLPAMQDPSWKFSSNHVGVLDTIGDLNALYSLSDVAFVGGSLVRKGGHNPIEPAVFGKAVFFGPHMDNFREIRDVFIREKAAVEVADQASLEYELRTVLSNPAVLAGIGQRGKILLDKNRGAALKTFGQIQALLSCEGRKGA